MKPINCYANIYGPIGYAHHARKFFAALNKLLPVCLVPKFPHLPDEAGEEEFAGMLRRLESIDLSAMAINLDYPEEMTRFTGSKKIAYTVFESEKVSVSGLNQLRQMDQVWVPTHWGRDVLAQNGLDPGIIRVVPEGVDSQVFSAQWPPYSEVASLEGFKFLSVGKWEERKGVRELLQAFDMAFEPGDKVHLILYYPAHVSALKGINVNEEIDKMSLKNKSRIIVVDTPLPREIDMARLYRSCDAYVCASKAEGWGLPITEAMACALPVIAPLYSGPTEYLTPENSIGFPIVEKEDVYCPVFFPHRGQYGQWARIDEVELAGKMRWVFENQSLAKIMGERAALDMRRLWSWDHAAQKALHCLADLEI